MFEQATVLIATKAATLTFGAILTYLAYQAYSRTGSPALRALAAGIGLVTTGAVIGGVLHQFVDVSLGMSASVQSAFTAAGFAVLTYSLYTESAAEPAG